MTEDINWKNILKHFKIDDFIIDLVEDSVEDEKLEFLHDYEYEKAMSE